MFRNATQGSLVEFYLRYELICWLQLPSCSSVT